MCGICGIIADEARGVDERILRRMADTLYLRGPDEEGVKTFPGIGLGFRRLSILDLEGSHQPLANEDGTVWTVCNGEIYNYRELREELVESGHVFATKGDVEVVVHAYEEWGAEFPKRLRGMFALALHDRRTNETLLLRDRLGIKPLVYAHDGNRLVFGSDIRAVLASGMVSNEIDQAAIDLYLSFMCIPAPYSIYRAIRKLPPASLLRWKQGRVQLETYWSPPQETACPDPHAAVEQLDALLRESMRLHLRSDVPLGFFLSGGLDSSALVALAALEGHARPRTFSVGFETRSHNELGFARQVADAFGCEHHELMVRADAAEVLPAIVAQFGEPFGDSSAVPMHYICRAAADSVKVVVGGDGGDELFAGYEWTRRQRFIEYWNRAPGFVHRGARAFVAGHEKERRYLGKAARFVGDAGQTPLAGYTRRVSCFTPELKNRLYGPGMREELRTDRARQMLACFFDAPGSNSISAMNRADVGMYLPDDDLCKVDRMTMMHSLEGRVPLLDHKVAEFAFSLPMHMKLRGLTSKYILKKTMSGILPGVTLKQRKQGFAVPVARWMRQDLCQEMQRLFASSFLIGNEIIDREALVGMTEEHLAGRVDHGHRLWAILILEIWVRISGGQNGQALRAVSLTDL